MIMYKDEWFLLKNFHNKVFSKIKMFNNNQKKAVQTLMLIKNKNYRLILKILKLI